MALRIVFVLVVATISLTGNGRGQQAGDGSTDMEFRAIYVPPSVFSTLDSSNRSGLRTPKAGVRIVAGERNVFDVREFLAKYGISFPAGSMATYDGELIVRDTAPNLALLDHLFGNAHLLDPGVAYPVSIEVSTYKCAPPISKKVPPWDELMAADVAALPRGSVKLVDRHSIVTKSGQRCLSENFTGNKGLSVGFKNGGTGSILELEPVIGPDLETIDTNLALHARIPTPGADAKGCTDIDVTTSFSVWNEYPVVIHTACVNNEPGKYFVVVAQAKLIDLNEPNEFILAPPAAGTKPGVVAKGANIAPPNMIMKRYRVPPGFLMSIPGPPPGPDGKPARLTAHDFLQSAGVSFPPGSDAVYDPETSSLIIINTKENIDLVDEIVDSMNSAVPVMASAELSAYRCDFSDAKAPPDPAKLTFADLERMQRKDIKAIDSVSLVTKSGQRAVATDVAEPDASKEPGLTDQDGFREGQTGMVFEAEPVIEADGIKVDTRIKFDLQLDEADGKGGAHTGKFEKEVTISEAAGTPRVIMVSPVDGQKSKFIVVVARTRLITPGDSYYKAPPPRQPAPPLELDGGTQSPNPK